MHRPSLKAAMRCPSTSDHGPSILIKLQFWLSSEEARSCHRIPPSMFPPSATMGQCTWPSPGLESWQERWAHPAWRTGVSPAQSAQLRGKERAAAGGSAGRHLRGSRGRRPDGEWPPGSWQTDSGSGRGSPCGHRRQHTWGQHKINRCAYGKQVHASCCGGEECSQARSLLGESGSDRFPSENRTWVLRLPDLCSGDKIQVDTLLIVLNCLSNFNLS